MPKKKFTFAKKGQNAKKKEEPIKASQDLGEKYMQGEHLSIKGLSN